VTCAVASAARAAGVPTGIEQEPKAGSFTASTVTVMTALATAPWLSVTR